jgi:hypothetical protein
VGWLDGLVIGCTLGRGETDGASLGKCEGFALSEGGRVGWLDGLVLGCTLGRGESDGASLGIKLGALVREACGG